MDDRKIIVKIVDRLARSFRYEVIEGELILDFLKREGYPSSSVIVYENGVIVSEFVTYFKRNCAYEIEMVRAYHLPDIMDRSMDMNAIPPGVVYAKNFMELTEDGGGVNKISLFNQQMFVNHFEKAFLQSTLSRKDLFEKNDKILVAFSGGRDSLSLILLLVRLKSILPNMEITAVTVNDCIDKLDLEYTIRLCKEFGILHIIKEKKDIEHAFHINKDFESVLKQLYSKYGRQHSLYTLHYVMRHLVEQVAEEIGAKKIALGLHLEDITASILRSVTTGYWVGFPWKRDFGGIKYIYPLWALPKKEITLYIKMTATKYSNQGSAATFDRGTVDRDIYYALADHCNDIWPGFSLHLFEGYTNILNNVKDDCVQYKKCKNCNGTYAMFKIDGKQDLDNEYCAVCSDLSSIDCVALNKSASKPKILSFKGNHSEN